MPRMPQPTDFVRLDVYVQARASRTEWAGMHGGALKLRVAAPPLDDAAHRAVIEFLAEGLGVVKRRVRLVAGPSSRKKSFEIDALSDRMVRAALRQP
jgi:uncharacterized protein